MAGVYFSYYFPLALQIFWIIFFFITLIITPTQYKIKQYSFNILNNNYFSNHILFINLFFQVYTLLTTKTYFNFIDNITIFFFLSLLILLLVIFFLLYIFSFEKKIQNQINIIYMFLTLTIYFIYLSQNLITFLVIVEIIAVIYYFLLLNYSNKLNINILKFKNIISLYLWLSFITLIIFSLAIILSVFFFGTLNFKELNSFSGVFSKYNIVIVLLILSLFWKIAAPGFHFYKLEIYRYLSLDTLFIYIIFSFFLNTILVTFLFFYLNTFFINFKNIIIFILLICNIILIVTNMSSITLGSFLVLSSINTWIFLMITLIA